MISGLVDYIECLDRDVRVVLGCREPPVSLLAHGASVATVEITRGGSSDVI